MSHLPTVDGANLSLLSQYHGGQWSALYSFVSTGGEVHDRHGLQRELEEAIGLAREHSPEDLDDLSDALRMVAGLPRPITWEFVGYGGTITFPDGRTLWLQGDEANALDDALGRCETDDSEQWFLSTYSEVAE